MGGRAVTPATLARLAVGAVLIGLAWYAIGHLLAYLNGGRRS